MLGLLLPLLGFALLDSLNVLNLGVTSAVVYDSRLSRRSALPGGLSFIGGVFAATSESGEPILISSGGGVNGSSLESSNTDISEEFTKLIITQQAYAAGTRIVSTADQMLQEALNMVR